MEMITDGEGPDAPLAAVVDPPTPPTTGLGHVRALDGVRGVAVALVVLFHFAPDVLPAGFLGVDVFFVLSGFLISSLALGEHRATARVSAPAFFARRARRLLPAAIVTVVVVVAIAVALDPGAYRTTLRGQAVASLLYVNNWWAIAQHDTYRALFGAESPLTHFWSLSIEEQFYIVLPFVLLALVAVARRWRRSTTALAAMLGVLAGVGTLASATWMAVLYDPNVEPSRLYYGTDTRVQAVLLGVVGGCAVWLLRERERPGGPARRSGPAWTLIAVVATVAILVASLRGGFLQSWLYLGGFFGLAVVALLLVVSVVLHRGTAARVFEVRPLVVLGLFSYGIYLWHWPVAVFLDERRTGLDGWPLFGVRIVVTAVATYASYRLVEKPFRSPRDSSEPARTARLLRSPRGAVVGVLAVALAVGFVWIDARPVPVEYANRVDDVPPPRTGAVRMIWAGDSVAWTMAGGEMRFPKPDGYETVFDPGRIAMWNLATYPCSMIAATSRSFGAVRSDPLTCWERGTTWPAAIEQFRPELLVWNGALFDLVDVLVGGRWVLFGTAEWDAVYLAALEAARSAATVDGTTFVLVGQPDPRPFASERLNEALLPGNLWRFGHLRELERRFAEQHPSDTRYLDLEELLCPSGTCPTTSADGIELRPDGIHFSVEGARIIAPVVTVALERLAGHVTPGD